jgi:hypothetical protein
VIKKWGMGLFSKTIPCECHPTEHFPINNKAERDDMINDYLFWQVKG